jgi:hypothetical protein
MERRLAAIEVTLEIGARSGWEPFTRDSSSWSAA